MENAQCAFCRIADKQITAYIVFENQKLIAFLDSDPLFPGHVLISPREHFETLVDLPERLVEPLFVMTKRMAQAVETAMAAEGTFIAINNRVSQTVPHLHIHVVPRRRRDGLRGFFWPRQQYTGEETRQAVCDAIRNELQKVAGAEA